MERDTNIKRIERDIEIRKEKSSVFSNNQIVIHINFCFKQYLLLSKKQNKLKIIDRIIIF